MDSSEQSYVLSDLTTRFRNKLNHICAKNDQSLWSINEVCGVLNQVLNEMATDVEPEPLIERDFDKGTVKYHEHGQESFYGE